MAIMERYCKAYPVKRFREFPGWTSDQLMQEPKTEGGNGEDGYLFLQESLRVTEGIFTDEGVVFDRITPEWEMFCRDELKFEVPATDLDDPAESPS